MDINDLVVDEVTHPTEVENDEFAQLVEGYVTFDDSPLDTIVQFSDAFNALDEKQQVVVAIGAMEAMYRLDLRSTPFVSVATLLDDTPFDTSYYPYLRELEQDGVVERAKSEGYRLRDIDAVRSCLP